MAPVKGILSIPQTFAPRKGSGQRQTLWATQKLTTGVNLEGRFTWHSRLIHFVKLWGSSTWHFSNLSNIELLSPSLKNGYVSPNLVIGLSEVCRLRFSYRNNTHLLASRQTLSALTRITQDLQGHCSGPDLTARHHASRENKHTPLAWECWQQKSSKKTSWCKIESVCYTSLSLELSHRASFLCIHSPESSSPHFLEKGLISVLCICCHKSNHIHLQRLNSITIHGP